MIIILLDWLDLRGDELMTDILSVTEVARNLSDVINRVHYQGKSYVLTRGGVTVAQLSPAGKRLTGADLARRWTERPRLDPADAASWVAELAAQKRDVAPPTEDAWAS
jgi:antitoxin (DNA-binding transcriptional repressor) of toxin-antitoxin stability system